MTELIVSSLGCVVFFGLIVRSNHIDDMKRRKEIFVRRLTEEARGTTPPTTEKVYR
jgi:hypothetical protein